jgi:hypothetical protein
MGDVWRSFRDSAVETHDSAVETDDSGAETGTRAQEWVADPPLAMLKGQHRQLDA